MILVDTTVVIDLLRESQPAQAWLGQQTAPLAACEITRVEILRGMRSGERPVVARALDTIHWFALDAEVAQRAGELGRRYRASHALAVTDLVVAATAQHHDLVLATSNVRHFPMFDRLRPPY